LKPGRTGKSEEWNMRKLGGATALTALGAAFILCASAPGLPAAEGTGAGELAQGKRLFEEKCSRCHEIDKPLARDMPRPEWEELLIAMAGRGAEMNAAEKVLILDYLSARYVFTSKCTVCHTKERILDREQMYSSWKKTVEMMAVKDPSLLTKEEARAIISYLAIVLGPPQAP